MLIKIVIFVLCAGSWDKIQLRIPATPHTLTVGGHALDKMKTPDYDYIIVESFTPTDTSGRHGLVHIRPIAGQEPFKTTMFVECSKELMNDYPVGIKFKIICQLI